MSVKKEASGRRSVQVEVEVPGTPEEVWRAIATGPGISSWFVPAEFEERDGKPVAVTLNFGPGMDSRSVVTAWDPPHKYAAQGEGWGGSPPIADEWTVEARAGGTCLVRIVHSLFASTDDWDNQLEGTESGWPGFFRILKIYLTHFRGQRSAMMQWIAPAAGTVGGGMGIADRNTRADWSERRATLDRPVGCSGAQRRGRARERTSVQRAGAARHAGARRRRSRRRQLRRLDGHAQFLSLRRSGNRDRRTRDTALGRVDSRTLSDAVGAWHE